MQCRQKHQIKGRRDRHYIFYDELNHESIQENRELEEHFETALENEEFEIWYQPKIQCTFEKACGSGGSCAMAQGGWSTDSAA